MKRKKDSGFTLIELSIVIVIIALIIGGILVGRDLVSAAVLRKTGTAVERYRTAVYTFKSKYGAIPGDITYRKAQQFGLTAINAGLCFNGPFLGNGTIDDSTFGVAFTIQGNNCEAILFWRHLVEAGLILDSSIDVTAPLSFTGSPSPYPATTVESIRYIPAAPLSGAAFYLERIDPALPMNYISLDNVDSLHAGSNLWNHSAALTPMQAYSLDSKFDNGNPLTGLIWAFDNNTGTPAQPIWTVRIPAQSGTLSTDPYCLIGAPNSTYNMAGSTANQRACGLLFYVKEF